MGANPISPGSTKKFSSLFKLPVIAYGRVAASLPYGHRAADRWGVAGVGCAAVPPA